MTPEITLFRKDGGALTKQISLQDGVLRSDGSACLMPSGKAMRLRLEGAVALGHAIQQLKPYHALGLGRLRKGLPEEINIKTKNAITATETGAISRTNKNIVFAENVPAFALIDYDAKGLTEEVRQSIANFGGVWESLCVVIPELERAERVTRLSTSAGLYNLSTGDKIAGSEGKHIFVLIADGSDSERFLKTLHDRCWLHGLGWHMVGAAGQLLERSVVDRMVGDPSRLVFEAPPILVHPVGQDADARKPIAIEGEPLDTFVCCPPLTVVESAKLRELKAISAQSLASDSARERQIFIRKQADKIAKRTGSSATEAQKIAANWCDGILLPDVILPFDSADFNGCSVSDVLNDSLRFDGVTLSDPLEGETYGRCKAKVMLRADGTPWINSFAHGRTVYELRYGYKEIQRAIEAAKKDEVVTLLTGILKVAHVNVVERKSIIATASKCSGVNQRDISALWKEIEKEAEENKQKEEKEKRRTDKADKRPCLDVPAMDAEILPVCKSLDELLTQTPAFRQPLCRDVEGYVAEAARIRIPRTRAFENEAEQETDLPPPEQWGLRRMNEIDLAQAIEQRVRFVDANSRSVHLPTPFVRHYLRQSVSPLPLISAVATLPVVLADGVLLVPDGIDRDRGVWFQIPRELRKIVPSPEECDDAAVKKAMHFLCDEWLCDVATDHQGKCTLIATTLTLIERTLLDQRPCFFVTAGMRGGGKTTTLRMIIRAVTGLDPAASGWTGNEDERRKALLSYYLSGVVYIMWDNITRGTQIHCPHIEKSCTAEFYADRRLGVSETVTVSASSVHIFTGNNVGPKGDLASRSLMVRLDVGRPDPENRVFKHPDPVRWTDKHRAQILCALYTILLGNPVLRFPADAPCPTRFKLWWRLVGSAVENASELVGKELDFGRIFLDQESTEEEGVGLAEALVVLRRRWPAGATASEISEFMSVDIGNEDDALKEFVLGATPVRMLATNRTIGKKLSAHVDCPVRRGDEVLTLRAQLNRDKVLVYGVDVAGDYDDLF